MDVSVLGKRLIAQVLLMIFIITGCVPAEAPNSPRSLASQQGTGGAGGAGGGNNASPTGNNLGNGTSLPPKVEIRHLIEPNLSFDPSYSTGTGLPSGGSYVRKLTLPKNFAGRLYVAGINISTLASRHVRVRFRFGMNRESVVVPATVVQAPGITPQTPISVLVLDLRTEPFRNIRLPYDLFDYNDYGPDQTPVQDNRNSGLFCRGLQLQDDPTFIGVGRCDGRGLDGLPTNSDQPEEECLYSYAKVLDQGLVRLQSGVRVPLAPSRAQVHSAVSANYYQDQFAQQLLKPLADNIPNSQFRFSDFSSSTGSPALTFGVNTPSLWDGFTLPNTSTTYFYRGPYRLVNRGEWQFRYSFDELHGPKRLFREDSWVSYPRSVFGALPDDTGVPDPQTRIYFHSYLFPLATRLNLPGGVAHLSSSTWDGVRQPTTLPSAGQTLWMDGSSARAQSINSQLEHIGSCNVSATIEIIAKDDNGNDFVISEAKDVKLQLVRPVQHRTDSGNEVLFSNFKSCTSSSACGSSECCLNNRCWDETLVSQCFDQNSGQGNRQVGAGCATDFDCSSLCCNRTTGTCAPHNSFLNPAVLCSKPVGEFCIAKEWCQRAPVTKCLIIKQGTDPAGNQLCKQHCYTVQELGDCRNGVCVPPVQEPIPAFNENAPGACDNAVPAPSF